MLRKIFLVFLLLIILSFSVFSDSRGSNTTLLQSSEQKQKNHRKKYKIHAPKDVEQARQEWFYHQRAYPFKEIPAGARQKAIDYLRQKIKDNTTKSSLSVSPSANGWESLGPRPIQNGSLALMGNKRNATTGRITAIAPCCGNGTILVGTARGGVWRTTNNGSDWSPLTDFEDSLSIGSLVVDPSDPNTVYMGTGEKSYLDSYFGTGILKTTDGKTFKRKSVNTFVSVSIADIAIDPKNSKIVYAAVGRGFGVAPYSPAERIDPPQSPKPSPSGVYKSTDGGENWNILNLKGEMTKIQIDPKNSNIVYAAQNDAPYYNGKGDSAIYKSTDSGQTWSKLASFPRSNNTAPFGRISFQIAPSDNQTIYAAVENAQTTGLFNRVIFHSTDGGKSWEQLQIPITYTEDDGKDTNICTCRFTNEIAISPKDPNFFFFGGTLLYKYYKLPDGTSQFTQESIDKIHVDVHAIVLDPKQSDKIYVGTDGGIWIGQISSPKNSVDWRNSNGEANPLSITEFIGLAVDSTNQMLVGGTQDNGVVFSFSDKNWTESTDKNFPAALGDAGSILIDPTSNKVIYFSSPRVDSGDSILGKSIDANSFISIDPPKSVLSDKDRLLFYIPLVFDPTNTKIIYIGSQKLLRNTEAGALDKWEITTTNKNVDLTTGQQKDGFAPAISAIAVGRTIPSVPKIIYVGTSDGNVQISTDEGKTFVNKKSSILPDRYITRIVADSTDPKTAYITYSGFDTKGHIYKTGDIGDKWTNISGDLPNIPINCLVTDQINKNKLYIGTDIGVFVTEDGGNKWNPLENKSLPNTAVFDLVLNKNTLYAATHGRGVWRLKLASSCPTITLTEIAGTSLDNRNSTNIVVDKDYFAEISAMGGTPNYKFEVTSGTLPPGLQLTSDKDKGIIQGKVSSANLPMLPAFFRFTITATDSNGCFGSQQYLFFVGKETDLNGAFSPPILSNGVMNTAYTQTITLGSGTPPYNFTITSGNLPTGLTLSPNGMISGMPSQTGIFSFTIQATDGNGNTYQQIYTLVITSTPCPTIALNKTVLHSGMVGQDYEEKLSATGGNAPYKFVVNGTLPTGLVLSPSGRLSGRADAGNYSFLITVTDANGCSISQQFNLAINCPNIQISPSSLPDSDVAVAYNQKVAASGGVAPYSYKVTLGVFPQGLTLSDSGVITGIPKPGFYDFTITATDANNCTVSQFYSVKINCPKITLSDIPDTIAGTAYNQKISVTGGQAPYGFDLRSARLPEGLTLSTDGVLSGTAVRGDYLFNLSVEDANGCTGQKSYSFSVKCPSISMTPSSLPDGKVGNNYNQSLIASGGVSPYVFTIKSGRIPSGLTFSPTGQISRVPNIAGNYTFTIEVSDSGSCTTTQIYSINIVPDLLILPPTLENGFVGTSYEKQLQVVGGNPGYKFVALEPLPDGLTLSSTGMISGIASRAGKFSFRVMATDSNGFTTIRLYEVIICGSINFSSPQLPDGKIGVLYNQKVSAEGSTPPYSLSILNGRLPNGLTLSPSGSITGIPTEPGNFSFTITAVDSISCSGFQTYSLSINCPIISISPFTLSRGIIGIAYMEKLTATGGNSPYKFATTSPLPDGLILSSDGEITGTPKVQGDFSVIVKSTDASGCAGSQTYLLTIGLTSITCPTISLSPNRLISGIANQSYSQTITANGGQSPYTFTVMGTLPAGLLLSSNGAISGIPKTVGNSTFTVIVRDANGCISNQNYTLSINCPVILLNPSSLANATVNTPYGQTITANGGQMPYIFTVSGMLPTGLSLSTSGIISGTPSTQGSFTFTVTTKDVSNCSGSQIFTIVVGCAAITLNPNSLPSGQVNSQYNQTITANGGTSPYSFTLTGALPTGLSLAANGILSGIPTAQATFNFTVNAKDSNNCTGSQTYAIIINPAACPTITLSPNSLPNGQVNSSYSQTITANGGQSPYSFTLSGTLPTGLSLSSNGTISGTPSSQGSFSFTVMAKDTNNCIGSQPYTIMVVAAPCPTITLNPTSLPSATISTQYDQAITASGGQAPYTFALVSGTLPGGLTFSSNGDISGIPTEVGTFSFTIKVTDNNGCQATQNYTLQVGGISAFVLHENSYLVLISQNTKPEVLFNIY